MSLVLRADGFTNGDCGVYKDYADQDEVWLTFGLKFTDTSDSFQTGYAGDVGGVGYGTGGLTPWHGGSGLLTFQVGANFSPFIDMDSWVSDYVPTGYSGAFDNTVPALAPDHWFLCEIHYNKATNCDVYVDGTTVFTSSITDTRQSNKSFLGQIFAGCVVYFRDAKIGTTRGGTEIFSDDFSGGDLSNWTGSFGPVTVVEDPAVGPGPPANDNFANASDIVSNPFTTLGGTTIAATNEAPDALEAALGHSAGGRSVWFKFTAGADGFLSMEVVGGSGEPINPADVSIGVFTGASLAALVPVRVSESPILNHVPIAEGVSYYIELDSSTPGDFTINLIWDYPHLHVTLRMDDSEETGTDPTGRFGPFTFVSTGSVECRRSLGMRTLVFGPAGNLPAVNIMDVRNLKVGTTGWGTSDVFDAVLSTDWVSSQLDTGPVPPFDSAQVYGDSVSGRGLRIFTSGGILTFQNDWFTAGPSYTRLIKDFGADYTELYIEWEFKLNNNWTSGTPLGSFPDLYQLQGTAGFGPTIGNMNYDAGFIRTSPDPSAHTTGAFLARGLSDFAGFRDGGAVIWPYPRDALSNWRPDTWMKVGVHYWVTYPNNQSILHLETS